MRYKIILEYDGTRYSGWQYQANARSIQGELLQVYREVFGTQAREIYGSGRTDAGVHARGQVAHFDAPPGARLSADQIMMRFNDALPHDINILSVSRAAPDFHARYDAKQRHYTYQISLRRDAFGKKYVWWIRDPLDRGAMQSAAVLLRGFHDFVSFGQHDKEKQSTQVNLTRLDLEEADQRLLIRVSGSHFLWKMVRRITGVLVAVGRGELSPADVQSFLEKPSREPAKYTAPPSGLFLEGVDY